MRKSRGMGDILPSKMPGKEIIVVGDDGARLGPNESGTLYFRDAMGMDFEYHNAPDKTTDVHLEPGVFTTGDVGYIDADGFLFLTDRKAYMIISGGVNIYPQEVESALAMHPAVFDVAVIGVPHPEMGEEVKAVVQLAPGVAGSGVLALQLIEYVRDRIAHFKAPRSVDFVDDLPRTPTGKLVKNALKEWYRMGAAQ
jgi:fatty-acyl-CoA synthase